MGSDQTATIRPALRELLQAFKDGEADADKLCATFTVPDQPHIWIQALHGTINAAYPHSEEPLTYIQRAGLPLLPDLVVDAWRPGQYATFTHESSSADSIAEFIDRLLISLHTLDANDYDIDIAFEHVA